MKRFLIAFFFASSFLYVLAQTEGNDSIQINNEKNIVPGSMEMQDNSSSAQHQHLDSLPASRYANPTVQLGQRQEIPTFNFHFPTDPYIARWYNGGLYGQINTQVMPGMMGIESGRFTLQQNLGNFTLSGYGEALKYGFFGGLATSYEFGGSLSYRANDKLSFTAFGSYYTSPGMTFSPAMAGYMQVPTFGGYADYRFNSRWGVRLGAQSYRSVMDNRWETQPIMMPYFKISEKNEIGIDVGGILYQLIRTNTGNGDWGSRGNPTLQPPTPGMPPVR